MNFEEMLNQTNRATARQDQLLVGALQRRQIGGKYRNVVSLRYDLSDRNEFMDALADDQRYSLSLKIPQQMHYVVGDSEGRRQLELEQGNYQTLASLLADNPAVVAQKDFVSQLVEQLAEALKRLHADHVCQVCLAPRNILMLKGDASRAMLLVHGSFYQGHGLEALLYKGVERYVAPEAMNGQATPQSDVYALGRLMETLFENASMPMGLKAVVRRATADNPAERYESIAQLQSAISRRHALRRSVLTFVAALLVALTGIGLYFEMMPQSASVEFVEPKASEPEPDWFGDSFDPEAELDADPDKSGLTGDTTLTEEEKKRLDEYQSKAEEIFKKRFTREADRILSRVYSNDRMGAEEKTFVAGSKVLMEQLIEKQNELGEQAGLSPTRTGQLANDIINTITAQKQKALTRNGYLRPGQGDDADE